MIRNLKHIATGILSLMVLAVVGREPIYPKNYGNGTVKSTSDEIAEPCAAASAVAMLSYNNVSARLENGGGLWLDRSIGRAAYIAPKGSNPQTTAIYAGALWMGGKGPDGQLKVAGVTFRQSGSNDFWPGPLTNDGKAETTKENCTKWDKFFTASKPEVANHRAYYSSTDEERALNFPNGYNIPRSINEWPAHGEIGQDYIIAPFVDFNEDGIYEPTDGDYPGYDLIGDVECRSDSRTVPLFGDTTIYWVFNDKGDIHTQTGGSPIGMEIRAQAFAFSAEDEVNNMTFYNYVLINQGTQRLTETFFGQWVDADLGGFDDDYVGCDVTRGLGYCYNGDNFDEDDANNTGYGATPPAIGIDFFEGPFQDNDYISAATGELYVGEKRDSLDIPFDNPLTDNAADAFDSLGIPYKGLGIGYGDGVGNNERFGMRKFVFYNSGGGPNGDPSANGGQDYYSYLTGNWIASGGPMVYGGDGIISGSGDPDQPADFMFPGETDVVGFGTGGNVQDSWTEVTAGNDPGDRRFLQSAGPFTLLPGAVNNITVGVVFARAKNGDAEASVTTLKIADDKAQQLFDNCFQILEGPDAPDLTVREFDKELIIYLTNPNTSNNNIDFNEDYVKLDPKASFQTTDGDSLTELQRSYVFQGYKVYQLKGPEVSVGDIDDNNLARLIYQCDIQDSISTLINYTLDPDMKLPVPSIMTEGSNNGIKHSFRVTTDAFAQGANQLVNHKSYYFVAIAYAANMYEEYNPVDGTGQAVQYLASRKNGKGGAISSVVGIPHITEPNVQLNSQYGQTFPITRVEGIGNGFNTLKISDETREKMVRSQVWDPVDSAYKYAGLDTIHYEVNGSPLKVSVVDPLMLRAGKYEINLLDKQFTGTERYLELNDSEVEIVRYDFAGNEKERLNSVSTIDVGSELYFPDLGIAVDIVQYDGGAPISSGPKPSNGLGYDSKNIPAHMLESEMVFEEGTKEPWIIPISDGEGDVGNNWILSGTFNNGTEPENIEYRDILNADPRDEYENILNGGWAPYSMVAAHTDGPLDASYNSGSSNGNTYRFDKDAYIINNPNVDVVLTPDTSLWTRCVVLEMSTDAPTQKGRIKNAPSVDKEGNTGTPQSKLVDSTGMGWFPGYAVDIETGDRLNMAFGEASSLKSPLTGRGNDMLYNPSPFVYSPNNNGSYYGAGKHYIFVFRNQERIYGDKPVSFEMPAYDQGAFSRQYLGSPVGIFRQRAWKSCAWVGLYQRGAEWDYELIAGGQGGVRQNLVREYDWLQGEVRFSIRIARPYQKASTLTSHIDSVNESKNNWNPKYLFEVSPSMASTKTIAENAVDSIKQKILDLMNVVPNPYYSYNGYEGNKLDSRVKFTNIPQKANIKVFTANGTIVKAINKDSDLPSIDWNLLNEQNIPISSGTYIIHINVPGVGEKVIKWFVVMRKPELQNF